MPLSFAGHPLRPLSRAAGTTGTRRVSYSLAGGVLALGAPLGLCLVRLVRGGVPSAAWVGRELASDLWPYLYLLASTFVVFSIFGFVLGAQADRLLELSGTDSRSIWTG